MSAPFETEIRTLLSLASERGLSDVEVYAKRDTGLTLRANKGDLESFQRSDSVGVGLRVIRGERAGYAYTENLSADALARALDEAAANAELVSPEPGTALATNGQSLDAPSLYNPALDAVALSDKIALAKRLESAAYEADPRVKTVPGCSYSDGTSVVRVANSHGLDRYYRTNLAYAFVYPLASENGENKTAFELTAGRDFSAFDAVELARRAVEGATRRLGSQELKSGRYPVVFAPKAMVELLASFSSVFSAKAALEGKSLLAGKENQAVASPLVQLIDDPLLAEGLASRPFDDEGVPSRRLALIENGVFKSFLHNTRTANAFKTQSTGHAGRGGYKGTIDVSPSNMFIAAGPSDLAALVADAGAVVLIDDLQGLHAGTNAVSGDFSLAAQGYLYENGEFRHPVHNFTVAGNFVDLLSGVEAVGNDLKFYPQGGYIGSPSVRVKELAFAGA